MALIDIIKCESDGNNFCQKFPSEDLRVGSQLVVYTSQTAFFVKGGKICDEFLAGTYTIKTSNIPLLNKIINIPFGGDSPFQAEVWFVNHISKLDIKWGTPQPIQIEEPRYNIIVPVRAFGQYGFRVANARKFLEDGCKVKITVRFRGRELNYAKSGEDLLNKFAEELSDVSNLDKKPSLEGKNMFIMLSSK